MKELESNLALSVLAVISIAVLAGCSTTGHRKPVIPAEPDYDKSSAATADSAAAKLNVSVKTVSAEDDDTRTVANRVRNTVKGRLAASGFSINNMPADLRVVLNVETAPFDKLGNTYRFSGEVESTARRLFDGRLMGRETIALKGKREQGKSDALRALANQLAKKAGAWLVDTCTAATSGLGADNVFINRRGVIGNDSEYAETFVRQVQNMDGVISCELIDQNFDDRKMTFRIVYFKDKFPAGILNGLANKSELEMKPTD